MIDIKKQVHHWQAGSEEDFAVAGELLEKGRIRHSLFFGHLALEKILKANVCLETGDLAPPIHNLNRLAENCTLNISQKRLDFFAEVNEFNIEGRYPGLLLPLPSQEEAEKYLQEIGAVIKWLKNQLNR